MSERRITVSSLMKASPVASLGGLDVNAYAAFQASRDLRDVVDRVGCLRGANGIKSSLTVRANLMTPILPMLVRVGVPHPFPPNPSHLPPNGPYTDTVLARLFLLSCTVCTLPRVVFTGVSYVCVMQHRRPQSVVRTTRP